MSDTVKIKVAELEDEALNWAVATCEGYKNLRVGVFSATLIMDPPRVEFGAVQLADLAYSADWGQGGPIIDREGIGFFQKTDEGYSQAAKPGAEFVQRGATPLVAAMRCYVASKLGIEVEVPVELL